MFSRSSVGGIEEGIREVKETAILTNSTFCVSAFLGSSLVRLRFLARERLVRYKGKEY